MQGEDPADLEDSLATESFLVSVAGRDHVVTVNDGPQADMVEV